MSTILPDNTYCAGDLITERLAVNHEMYIPEVTTNQVTTPVAYVTSRLECPDIAGGSVATNSCDTNSLTLSDETIVRWQDLIDYNYITVPIPVQPMVLYDGTGNLYDDYTSTSTQQPFHDKLLMSNPNRYSTWPYNYILQSQPNTWMFNVPNYQRFYTTITNLVTMAGTINRYRHHVTYDPNGTGYMYMILGTSSHGLAHTCLYSEVQVPMSFPETRTSAYIAHATLRMSSTSSTYDVIVRPRHIYIDNEELANAIPENCQVVHACVYNVDEMLLTCVDGRTDHYYTILRLINKTIAYTTELTSDNIPAGYTWSISRYPVAWHYTNNSVCIAIRELDSSSTPCITIYQVDTEEPTPLLFEMLRIKDGTDAHISHSYRLKMYMTVTNDVVLADDWDYASATPDPSIISSTYPCLLCMYHVSQVSQQLYYMPLATQESVNFHGMFKGMMNFSPVDDTNVMICYQFVSSPAVYRYTCKSMSIGLNGVSGANGVNSINQDISLSAYDQTIYGLASSCTPTYDNQLMFLMYCNWNVKCPFITFSRSQPWSSQATILDSAMYLVSINLFNLNHNTSNTDRTTYPIPRFMVDNKCLISNGQTFTF